jgi:hypothetical protein
MDSVVGRNDLTRRIDILQFCVDQAGLTMIKDRQNIVVNGLARRGGPGTLIEGIVDSAANEFVVRERGEACIVRR